MGAKIHRCFSYCFLFHENMAFLLTITIDPAFSNVYTYAKVASLFRKQKAAAITGRVMVFFRASPQEHRILYFSSKDQLYFFSILFLFFIFLHFWLSQIWTFDHSNIFFRTRTDWQYIVDLLWDIHGMTFKIYLKYVVNFVSNKMIIFVKKNNSELQFSDKCTNRIKIEKFPYEHKILFAMKIDDLPST